MIGAGTWALLLLCAAAPERDGEGAGAAPSAPPSAAAAQATGDPAREAAVRAAVERGVAWLVAGQAQGLDGSMPLGGGPETTGVPVAATALGALALMAAGNAPGRGPYGDALDRAVDYLLAHSDRDPRSKQHGFVGRTTSPTAVKMHSHGFATLALAQAFATSPRTERGHEIGAALEAAVRLIERTQGGEGAWFYSPQREAQHEGSVTVCLVQALRAARNAGIRVDQDVVRRAQAYIERTQRDDGLFAYQLGDPTAHTSVALTAAGLTTLYSLGEYAGPAVERGIDAIWRELARRDAGTGEESRFPHYERLYLAEAFWQHSDPGHFARWSADEFKRLLEEQESDGRWTSRAWGDGYATAVSCLVLCMSEELLPIFRR